MPLHCTQITVQGTVGRGSGENIYIGANLKKNYVRTCILCIGTLARILGALQSLHKAGIATFSWISKHQKQPTLSPFVFLFFWCIAHTCAAHVCGGFRCMCLHLCFPLKLLLFFYKHVFAAVPQISVFHSPNFRSAFFMQPIPPSSKNHQCFVLFVFFASNFLLIRPLHGSLHQLVLSRDCKEIIMWKTKLGKDHHIIMSSNECLIRIRVEWMQKRTIIIIIIILQLSAWQGSSYNHVLQLLPFWRICITISPQAVIIVFVINFGLNFLLARR